MTIRVTLRGARPIAFAVSMPALMRRAARFRPGQRVGYDFSELAGMYRLRMRRPARATTLYCSGCANLSVPGFGDSTSAAMVGVSYLQDGKTTFAIRRVCAGPCTRCRRSPVAGADLARERNATDLHFTASSPRARMHVVHRPQVRCNMSTVARGDSCTCPGPCPAISSSTKAAVRGDTFVTGQSTGRAFIPTVSTTDVSSFDESNGARLSRRRRLVESRAALRNSVHTRPHIDAYSGYYFQESDRRHRHRHCLEPIRVSRRFRTRRLMAQQGCRRGRCSSFAGPGSNSAAICRSV